MIMRIIQRQYDQLDYVYQQTLTEIDTLSKNISVADLTQHAEFERILKLISTIHGDVKTKQQNISRLSIHNRYEQLIDFYEQAYEDIQLLESFLENATLNEPDFNEADLQATNSKLTQPVKAQVLPFRTVANSSQRLDLTSNTVQSQVNESHFDYVSKWQESLNKSSVPPQSPPIFTLPDVPDQLPLVSTPIVAPQIVPPLPVLKEPELLVPVIHNMLDFQQPDPIISKTQSPLPPVPQILPTLTFDK